MTEFDGPARSATAKPASINWEAGGRLLKLLPAPVSLRQAERFLQIVQANIASQNK